MDAIPDGNVTAPPPATTDVRTMFVVGDVVHAQGPYMGMAPSEWTPAIICAVHPAGREFEVQFDERYRGGGWGDGRWWATLSEIRFSSTLADEITAGHVRGHLVGLPVGAGRYNLGMEQPDVFEPDRDRSAA